MKSETITIEKIVIFEKKRSQWLKTRTNDLAEIFNLSIRAIGVLKTIGIYKLEDLLVCHKEELLNGKAINVNALVTKRTKNIAVQVNKGCERNKRTGQKGNRKVGKKSMEEIEIMLKKLNMSLRETI